MNVGIGTVAAQFLFWEYLFRIFGIVSLQCRSQRYRILHVLYCIYTCNVFATNDEIQDMGPSSNLGSAPHVGSAN
jgi:hypothetical protein